MRSLRAHIVRDRDITWKHLAATCAIPFGLSAVEIEARFYVDGDCARDCPVAAEELGARRAVALNVLNTPGSVAASLLGRKRAGDR